MKIQKTIELEVTKKGKTIICRDMATLCLVCGTKSVSGNLKMYGIIKKGSKFFVTIDTIKERIKTLEYRKQTIEESLDIMRQIVKN